MPHISISYGPISESKPIVLRTCVGYSQRIGYQPRMSQLDAAVTRYNKLLETGPCSDLAWAEALHAHMESAKLSAGGRLICPFLRPQLISQASPNRLLRLLPAAVQKSQVANIIPSEISLPLKTTMSSRMRTIWPMTALNPISVRAALTADVGCFAHGIVTDRIGAATRTRLEFSCCAKAKRSKQHAVDRGCHTQPS